MNKPTRIGFLFARIQPDFLHQYSGENGPLTDVWYSPYVDINGQVILRYGEGDEDFYQVAREHLSLCRNPFHDGRVRVKNLGFSEEYLGEYEEAYDNLDGEALVRIIFDGVNNTTEDRNEIYVTAEILDTRIQFDRVNPWDIIPDADAEPNLLDHECVIEAVQAASLVGKVIALHEEDNGDLPEHLEQRLRSNGYLEFSVIDMRVNDDANQHAAIHVTHNGSSDYWLQLRYCHYVEVPEELHAMQEWMLPVLTALGSRQPVKVEVSSPGYYLGTRDDSIPMLIAKSCLIECPREWQEILNAPDAPPEITEQMLHDWLGEQMVDIIRQYPATTFCRGRCFQITGVQLPVECDTTEKVMAHLMANPGQLAPRREKVLSEDLINAAIGVHHLRIIELLPEQESGTDSDEDTVEVTIKIKKDVTKFVTEYHRVFEEGEFDIPRSIYEEGTEAVLQWLRDNDKMDYFSEMDSELRDSDVTDSECTGTHIQRIEVL